MVKLFQLSRSLWMLFQTLPSLLWEKSARQPPWAKASSFRRFLDHTQRRTTFGRTPLDKWSTRRRDRYLTTHNTHNKHPCPPLDSNHNFSRRAAVDLRLRPHGHWDRHIRSCTRNTKYITISQNTTKFIVLWCTICFTTTCFGPFL